MASTQNPFAGPPEDNPYQAPAPSVTRERSSDPYGLGAYRSVRTGLQMIYYGLTILLIGALLFVVSSVALGFSLGANTTGMRNEMPGILMILFGLFIVVCALVILVGFLICLTSPESNEKSKIGIALGCQVGGFILSFVGGYFSATTAQSGDLSSAVGIQLVCSLGGQILGILGSVFFILFCKQVAMNIGGYRFQDASKSALTWLFITVGMLVFYFVALLVVGSAAAGSGSREAAAAVGFVGLLGLPLLVFGIISLVKQLIMLRTGVEELTIK